VARGGEAGPRPEACRRGAQGGGRGVPGAQEKGSPFVREGREVNVWRAAEGGEGGSREGGGRGGGGARAGARGREGRVRTS